MKTMKLCGRKFLAIVLMLVVAASLLTGIGVSANAASGSVVASGECGADGADLTYQIIDNGDETCSLVIEGSGDMADNLVTDVPWFPYCTKITSVSLPDGLTHIGSYAFNGFTSLTEIDIPDSVTSYGNGAFRMSALTEFSIPDSITELSAELFVACPSLTKVDIPEGITEIPFFFCFNCTSLTEIIIPKSVTSIIASAFPASVPLENVYFTGTEEEWNEIYMESNNFALDNATIHYNYVREGSGISTSTDQVSAGSAISNGVDFACSYGGVIRESNGTFTITPYTADGITYVIDKVFVNGEEVEVSDNTGMTITADESTRSVFASFAYTVNFNDPANGTLSVSRGSETLTSGDIVRGGDVLTITATGIGDYELDSLSLTGIRDNGDGSFTVIAQNGEATPAVSAEMRFTLIRIDTPTAVSDLTYTGDEQVGVPEGIGYTLTGNTAKYAGTYTATAVLEEGYIWSDETKGPKEIEWSIASAADDSHVHSYEFVDAVPATCTESGLTSGILCPVCGEVLVAQKEVPAVGHNYVAEVTAPTCTEQGYTTHTCTECGDSYVDTYVNALGHTEVVDKAAAATCTETGLTEGSHCSVCGEILAAQEVIPALGHDYVDTVVDPTCTDLGYTEHVCSVCGDTYRDHYVANTGHIMGIVPAVAPTCTEPGLTMGIICTVSGEVLLPQAEVPAAGHNYKDAVTAPTCTEQGYTTHTCTVCGDSYVDTYVAALGHTEVVDGAVAATCTETGLTEGRHCSVCGEVLAAQEVIPALGHDYVATVVEPTCTDMGYTEYVCSVCGDTYRDNYVANTGHIMGIVPAVAATCTEPGLTMGIICDRTGEVLLPQVEIPATGHNYGDWIITKEATVSEEGLRIRICSDCGEIETEAISKVEAANGFVLDQAANQWVYMVNGEVYAKDTDIVKGVINDETAWWYVEDGKADLTYTGFAQNKYGWWYVEDGKVTFAKTDVIKGTVNGDTAWWYVKDSKVSFTNTIAKNSYGWWRIENGKVNFDCNSVEKNEYGWWYLSGGKVDFTYTGVARNAYGWWRIENGKVDFGFSGIAQNAYGWWYLQGGKVIFSYSGKVTYGGSTYTVSNGRVSR